MILYRLCQDIIDRYEGSCISEEKYKAIVWLDKCLYEPLTEEDLEMMIKVENDKYCSRFGLEGLYFWSDMEADIFRQKTDIYAIGN